MDEILEEHLDRLDSLPTLEGSIFSSEDDEERYESLLTYALRKYGAAHYHSRNLADHVKTDKRIIEELTLSTLSVTSQIDLN